MERDRKKEIVDACEKLYETMGFRDITIKEIAAFTSFTRPSIYYYFQTKEEIFLALMQREYEKWVSALSALRPTGDEDPRLAFAGQIAHTLEHREQLLKLISANYYDMEMNSRKENLVEFKKAYWRAFKALGQCLRRYCPSMTPEDADRFLSAFFPFLYGLYPYAVVQGKQRETMEEAGIIFNYQSIYELAFLGIRQLLGA